MEYDDELKRRVKHAHTKMKTEHPSVPPRGDQWVTDPQLRSEMIQHITQVPWSEREMLGCLLSLRKASKL